MEKADPLPMKCGYFGECHYFVLFYFDHGTVSPAFYWLLRCNGTTSVHVPHSAFSMLWEKNEAFCRAIRMAIDSWLREQENSHILLLRERLFTIFDLELAYELLITTKSNF